jgi:hypothetical protein
MYNTDSTAKLPYSCVHHGFSCALYFFFFLYIFFSLFRYDSDKNESISNVIEW